MAFQFCTILISCRGSEDKVSIGMVSKISQVGEDNNKTTKKITNNLISDPEQDTTNTISIHVGEHDKITLRQEEIKLENICDELSEFVIAGKGIYLTCEKATLCKTYLKVYKAIKGCILTLKDEKAS